MDMGTFLSIELHMISNKLKTSGLREYFSKKSTYQQEFILFGLMSLQLNPDP